MQEEGPFGYPEDFLKATQELSEGERDMFANLLRETTQQMIEVVDALPVIWPNRAELKEHVNAIYSLLPDLEERY